MDASFDSSRCARRLRMTTPPTDSHRRSVMVRSAAAQPGRVSNHAQRRGA